MTSHDDMSQTGIRFLPLWLLLAPQHYFVTSLASCLGLLVVVMFIVLHMLVLKQMNSWPAPAASGFKAVTGSSSLRQLGGQTTAIRGLVSGLRFAGAIRSGKCQAYNGLRFVETVIIGACDSAWLS